MQKHKNFGGEAAFIDAEHALDPVYAKKLGVDIDRLIVSQPNDGEEGLEIAEKLVRSSAVDVVVVDSVAALVTRAELEGNMGDAHIGLQARLMSQALRKLAAMMNKTNTTVIFINQLREKVGAYGNPETTPGGRALKFYSSVRLDVRRKETILEDGMPVGSLTHVKVVKNKVAPPFRVAAFTMRYGEGISALDDIIELGVEFGIINKAGSWFSYQDTKIGQGRDKVKVFLKENPEILKEVDKLVREKAKNSLDFIADEDFDEAVEVVESNDEE